MRKVKCGLCDGYGKGPKNLMKPCLKCDGHKYIYIPDKATEICGLCDGYGRGPENLLEPCPRCNADRFIVPQMVQSKQGLRLTFIENGMTDTAYKEIRDVLNEFAGHIRVCDPFLNDTALDKLTLVTSASKVQVLFRKDNSSAGRLTAFKYQYRRFEFCKAGRALHDRYIISSDTLTLLGHGLSNIGEADSFVIRLPKEYAEDVIKTCRATFDERWKNGNLV